MTEYLLLTFTNGAGDRQNVRLNDFDDSMTEEELREEMTKILDSKVLVGKNGPLTEIVTGKIVKISEDLLVEG